MKPVVAIVGLGQIGGSLAAALTRRRLARVVGISRRAATVRRALRMGIVAQGTTRLEAASGADIVVLAAPVRTLLRQIPRVVPLLRPGTLLTDVGSTKEEIIRAFRRARPRGPVLAGHPMAGNERAGLDGVDERLFEGRPWALRPVVAGPAAFRRFERLLRAIGARPFRVPDGRTHDLIVARVSHLPHLLAYALMGTPEEAVRRAGNSFRDATRVALSNADMVLDFLLTNRGPVARAAREFEKRLRRIGRLVARGDETALRRLILQASRRRDRMR